MSIFKKHFWYYLSLIVVLGIGFYLLFATNANKQLQILIAFLIALFYVLWGMLHHYFQHDTTIKVMIEYVLIGAIGFLLIALILQGNL